MIIAFESCPSALTRATLFYFETHYYFIFCTYLKSGNSMMMNCQRGFRFLYLLCSHEFPRLKIQSEIETLEIIYRNNLLYLLSMVWISEEQKDFQLPDFFPTQLHNIVVVLVICKFNFTTKPSASNLCVRLLQGG